MNGEKSTFQNKATKNLVLEVFVIEIDFTLFEIDAKDVNIHGEN